MPCRAWGRAWCTAQTASCICPHRPEGASYTRPRARPECARGAPSRLVFSCPLWILKEQRNNVLNDMTGLEDSLLTPYARKSIVDKRWWKRLHARGDCSCCVGTGYIPGKRFVLCGISSPPSTAPFRAPNTFAPVVVRARPTSKKHLNVLCSPCCSTSFWSPVTSLTPGYAESRPNFFRICVIKIYYHKWSYE